MILNIFYCIFFCLVNFLIYIRLEKSIHFDKEYFVYFFLLCILILHSSFLPSNHLMKNNDFFNLLVFSLCLIILHYGTNFQVSLFKKRIKTINIRDQKLQESLLSVFDFMRQKLIYIMLSTYQILAVCNENFR